MSKIANHVHIETTKGQYRFDVDGEDFPWFVSDRGPQVTRVADDLYAIAVEIFCLDRETKDYLPFTTAGGRCQYPVIGGTEFPWTMSDTGYTFRCGWKTFPTVALTFFAEDVESSTLLIDDVRHVCNENGDTLRTVSS
jgi:hypothetical protein